MFVVEFVVSNIIISNWVSFSLDIVISRLTNVFVDFIAPILLLFQVFCFAPSCRPSIINKYTNIICCFLTFSNCILTLCSMFELHMLNLPDDLTNQLGTISISVAYIVILFESFVKQCNYRRIFEHFAKFDSIISMKILEINVKAVYNRWKYRYYQQVYARLIFFNSLSRNWFDSLLWLETF